MKNKFLYQKIYKDMYDKILNGEWKVGCLIPKENELLEIYSIGRDTLRRALEKLKQDGLIYTKSGIGTYVKENKVTYKLSFIESFSEMVKKEGKSPRSIIYQARRIDPDDYVKEELSLKDEEKACFVERLRLSGNKVLCYEKTYINSKLCKDIEDYISPDSSLFELYEKKYNLKMSHGKHNLEAINASKFMSEVLGIKEGDALLLMNATIYTKEEVPVYTVEAYYVGAEYIFSAILPRNL